MFELVGYDARFYEHGRNVPKNCYEFTVTFPNKRSIHFSIHVLETTCVFDWSDLVIRKLKEAIKADDKYIETYLAFQGKGYY